VTECGVKRMAGCEACTQLTHLDLSHNKLTDMDPVVLGRLTKRRTLWLNDNAIQRVQGLEALGALTSLWLGANRIPSICDALTTNANLEELNLAGNLISNFKDIPNLARMRRLTSLCFSEPHFGDNPLCSLCNYQTYLLFHMTHLRVFDTQVITDDLRQLAEAVRDDAHPPPPLPRHCRTTGASAHHRGRARAPTPPPHSMPPPPRPLPPPLHHHHHRRICACCRRRRPTAGAPSGPPPSCRHRHAVRRHLPRPSGCAAPALSPASPSHPSHGHERRAHRRTRVRPVGRSARRRT
jgi:hypothetical protein